MTSEALADSSSRATECLTEKTVRLCIIIIKAKLKNTVKPDLCMENVGSVKLSCTSIQNLRLLGGIYCMCHFILNKVVP